MKKVLGAVAALLLIGLVVVYVQLGAIFKRALEAYGPKMLGAPVSVGVVTISPFSGQGTLRFLKIGNPAGFSSKHAITVGAIKVSLDVRSLFGGRTMLIKEIDVDGPEITVEMARGGTNLQRLERNLDAYSPAEPTEARKTSERKLEIKRFRLRGAKASVVGAGLEKSFDVPDLEITGIGEKSGGATAAEAAKQVLGAVVHQALRSSGAAETLLQRGSGLLKGLLKRK